MKIQSLILSSVLSWAVSGLAMPPEDANPVANHSTRRPLFRIEGGVGTFNPLVFQSGHRRLYLHPSSFMRTLVQAQKVPMSDSDSASLRALLAETFVAAIGKEDSQPAHLTALASALNSAQFSDSFLEEIFERLDQSRKSPL